MVNFQQDTYGVVQQIHSPLASTSIYNLTKDQTPMMCILAMDPDLHSGLYKAGQ